jgi:hypothetical protein
MADTLIYPRGQIAQGSGDLIDVTNIKLDQVNNGKQVHTIRRKAAGVTLGVEETTISFDSVVSEEGQERDYFTLVKKGIITQVRIKIPGETMTVNGIYTTRNFELPLDDAIKLSLTFIGAMSDSGV